MTTLSIEHPRKNPRVTRTGIAALAAGMIVWTTAAQAALPTAGYADLVEKVSPAVVFISTVQKKSGPMSMGRGQMQQPFDSPFPKGSPFEDFFKKFGEQMPQQRGPMTALGSGFIIDPAGYVVTNNHVIDGASKVQVKLHDGREFTAKVVGTDAKTDLALIKIKTAKPLPFVQFGDSAKMRPGDVVLAVGNPFGLGGTVTAGIVSGRNRDINAGPYDEYLQTDAPINRGNSGGPLFNTGGDVIGVNTAIFSPNGGSVGIGFAIPANPAKGVIAQLKDHGNVERGWLGVKIQMVSPEIAQAMDMDKAKGALVAEVTPNSPAAKAGLRAGDVVLGYNGKTVKSMRDLPRLVAVTRAGEKVKIDLWRNSKKMSVSARIGQLKQGKTASKDIAPALSGGSASPVLGADLAVLDDAAKAKLNLPAEVQGVVIASVDPEGRAAEAGMRAGDVIEKVGTKPVKTPADVKLALAKTKRSSVLFMINRGGERRFIGMKLAGA